MPNPERKANDEMRPAKIITAKRDMLCLIARQYAHGTATEAELCAAATEFVKARNTRDRILTMPLRFPTKGEGDGTT